MRKSIFAAWLFLFFVVSSIFAASSTYLTCSWSSVYSSGIYYYDTNLLDLSIVGQCSGDGDDTCPTGIATITVSKMSGYPPVLVPVDVKNVYFDKYCGESIGENIYHRNLKDLAGPGYYYWQVGFNGTQLLSSSVGVN